MRFATWLVRVEISVWNAHTTPLLFMTVSEWHRDTALKHKSKTLIFAFYNIRLSE